MGAKANPAPVGAFGSGILLFVLGFHYAGKTDFGPGVLVLAVFASGLLQVYTGILSYFTGNTFDLTLYLGSGLYAIALAGSYAFPMWEVLATPAKESFALFFMGWFLLMATLLAASLRTTIAHMVTLAVESLGLLILGIGFFIMDDKAVKYPACINAGGWFFVINGLMWIYIAFAVLYNESFKRTVCPMGERSKSD